MRRGDWKRYKDKRSFHQKISMDVDKWWASYPHYEHEAWSYAFMKVVTKEVEMLPGWKVNVIDHHASRRWSKYTQPSYKDKPKVKRGYMTVDDYKWYGRCPKAWNKIFHIRPVRRKWKRWCQVASRLIEVETYCQMHNWYDRKQGSHWAAWCDMDEEMMYCECEFEELDHISEGMPYPSHKMHIYYY